MKKGQSRRIFLCVCLLGLTLLMDYALYYIKSVSVFVFFGAGVAFFVCFNLLDESYSRHIFNKERRLGIYVMFLGALVFIGTLGLSWYSFMSMPVGAPSILLGFLLYFKFFLRKIPLTNYSPRVSLGGFLFIIWFTINSLDQRQFPNFAERSATMNSYVARIR